MKPAIVVAAVFSTLILASPVLAQPQYSGVPSNSRDGFVVSLSLGLGYTTFVPDGDGDSETEAGLAGLNLDLGTWVSPDLAVLLRISGTQFTLDFGPGAGDITFINAFVGVVGQYWLNEKMAVEGGAGLAIFGANDFEGETEKGFGINARGTYRLTKGWQGSIDVTPSYYDGITVVSTSLLAAYQWD